MVNGPIQDGLHIDHLCRIPRCVRPDHVEPVTLAENNRRMQAVKTACPAGHAYAEHGYLDGRGYRVCRPCIRIKNRESYYRKKARLARDHDLQ